MISTHSLHPNHFQLVIYWPIYCLMLNCCQTKTPSINQHPSGLIFPNLDEILFNQLLFIFSYNANTFIIFKLTSSIRNSTLLNVMTKLWFHSLQYCPAYLKCIVLGGLCLRSGACMGSKIQNIGHAITGARISMCRAFASETDRV
jgi:hypothetical protein